MTDGGGVIVDLKTGSSQPADADLDRNPQLGVYQLAVLLGAFERVRPDRAGRRGTGPGRQGRPARRRSRCSGSGRWPTIPTRAGRPAWSRRWPGHGRPGVRGHRQPGLPGLPGPVLLPGAPGRWPGDPMTYSPAQLARLLGLAEPTAEQAAVIARPGAAAGRDRRGRLGQERDHGGPAGLAGRQRHGPAGAGARPDLHQEGRGRAGRPGPGPAGRPAHGRAPGRRRRARPGRRAGGVHLPRLRGPAGHRPRAARGAGADAAADHPRGGLADRGPGGGRLRRPDGRGQLVAASRHRGRAELAGELAEHLRTPDEVAAVGEWLDAQAAALPGNRAGRLPAPVRKILDCQRTREQLLPHGGRLRAGQGRA